MANINTLLDERVTLEVESIDRLYLNGYIPTLETPGSPPPSVSTSRPDARFAPRRPSTTRATFGLGRKLCNLAAPREVGFAANRRLVGVQRLAQRCALSQQILEDVVLPSRQGALPAPALRFGDPRAMALLRALCRWSHLVEGFTNGSLRALVAGELGHPYSPARVLSSLAPSSCRKRDSNVQITSPQAG